MNAIKVYLEFPNAALDQTFTYLTGEFLVSKGVRVIVPLINKAVVGFVDEVFEIENLDEYEKNNKYKLKKIISVLDEQALLNDELLDLGKWIAQETMTPVIACYQAMLPKALKPQTKRKNIQTITYLQYIYTPEGLTEKQSSLLKTIQEKDIKKSDLKKAAYSIKKLLSLKAIKEVNKEKTAEKIIIGGQKPLTLTNKQQEVMDAIDAGNCNDVFLLRGVTGSGKTEIYLQLAWQYLQAGKQVLILVPEISLTPQMVKRVTDRFAQAVAIYHSGLNDQQKYEQYRLVMQGDVNIVVGTRSAVFMPFSNLGLIVLDEEHDMSYKQSTLPRYSCLDVALQRAKFHQAKVILGSATPSLESYSRAIKGIYKLVEMPDRIAGSLAKTYVVDMSRELRKGNEILSDYLVQLIKDRLSKHEQIILLLNRRGYAPVLKCANCGYVVKCEHCDVSMCYHKEDNTLRCHICGASISAKIACPTCNSHNWRSLGLGTEKLEETVKNCFPEAKIIRLDADVARKKGAHSRVINAFGNGEYDILLGTQMISKGLDFPNVTLVGILNADALLNRVDYRAAEMTFDLIVQASGRSGRSKKGGNVVIQVYNPNNYGIKCAALQDYIRFFKQEMKYRHLGNYPPYSFFISFIAQDKDEEKALNEINMIKQWLKENHQNDLLGPTDILKRQDYYRYRLLYRGKNLEEMKGYARQLYDLRRSKADKVRLIIDINPMGIDE